MIPEEIALLRKLQNADVRKLPMLKDALALLGFTVTPATFKIYCTSHGKPAYWEPMIDVEGYTIAGPNGLLRHVHGRSKVSPLTAMKIVLQLREDTDLPERLLAAIGMEPGKGTCSHCFSIHKLDKRGCLNGHRYVLPWSEIVADQQCRGRYLAFEASCDGTKNLLETTFTRYLSHKELLTVANNGTVTEIDVPKFFGSWKVTRVSKTDADWKEHFSTYLLKLEQRIKEEERLIKFLVRKIETWKVFP